MNGKGSWVELLVTAVPGLAAFVYGATLPSQLQPLFSAGLGVLLFSTLGIVLLSRTRITRWPIARAARWVVGLTGGAVAALLSFVLVQSNLVRSYRFLPEDEAAPVVIPAAVDASPLRITYPFLDCRESMNDRCDEPVARSAGSADEVVALLSSHGPWEIRLPGGAAWATTVAALFLLYAGAAVQMIAVFGILTVRRITPRRLVEVFTQPEGS